MVEIYYPLYNFFPNFVVNISHDVIDKWESYVYKYMRWVYHSCNTISSRSVGWSVVRSPCPFARKPLFCNIEKLVANYMLPSANTFPTPSSGRPNSHWYVWSLLEFKPSAETRITGEEKMKFECFCSAIMVRARVGKSKRGKSKGRWVPLGVRPWLK